MDEQRISGGYNEMESQNVRHPDSRDINVLQTNVSQAERKYVNFLRCQCHECSRKISHPIGIKDYILL